MKMKNGHLFCDFKFHENRSSVNKYLSNDGISWNSKLQVRWFNIYIYIYIYVCVCVCVCVLRECKT